MKRFVLLLAVLGTIACAPVEEPADFIVLNGRFVTMDAANPVAEAVAARDGRLVSVGTKAAAERLIGPETEVVDLGGAFAVPGLIEGHGHFLSVGRARMQLDLRSVSDFEEIVAMVETAVAGADSGQWILGRGWHQEKLSLIHI